MAKFLKLPVGPSTNSVWSGVAANGNTVVAVASSGRNRVARSVDGGVTWSFLDPGSSFNKGWSHVANSGNNFVAVASSGSGNRIMRSADGGASWVASTTSVIDGMTCVASDGAGKFVAIGLTNSYFSADNGDTWSTVSYVAAGAYQSVVWSGTTWIACRNDGTAATAFITGNASTLTSWSAQAGGVTGTWIELVRLGTTVVAISSTGGPSLTATGTQNGVTWTSNSGLPAGNYVAAASDGAAGMVVLSQVGPAATRIYTSTDGAIFTLRTTPNTDDTSQMWSAAASTGTNAFVVVSSSGGSTNRVAKSSALATWAGYNMSYVNTLETQSPNYYNVENFLYMRPGAQNTVIVDLDSANPSADTLTFTFGSDYSGATHEIIMNAIVAANSQELAPAGFFELTGTLSDGRFIDSNITIQA